MKLRIVLGLFSLAAIFGLETRAADLNGSFAFSGLNAAQNGTNLLDSTIFTFTNFLTNSNGVDDYVGIVTGTFWDGPNPAPNTGVLDVTSPTTMGGFTISNPNFGTFVASNTAQNQIVNQSANFIDIYLRGIFTPAGDISSFNPTDTSIRVSINLSGSSLSSAFTLNTPAVPVPEPSTYALGTLATIVLAAAARRKNRKATV